MFFVEMPFSFLIKNDIRPTNGFWISSQDGETEDHSSAAKIAILKEDIPFNADFPPANGMFIAETGTYIVQKTTGLFGNGRLICSSREETVTGSPTDGTAACFEAVTFPEKLPIRKPDRGVDLPRWFMSNDRW